MSYDYTKPAATALKLLTKFGKVVTLSRYTGNSIDPITGTVTAGTDASVTTTGLIKNYADGVVDGTRILSGDKELILSNEQVPTLTDQVTIDSQTWSIIAIKTINPADTVVCYFCQVRK
jgi:hypothetical protein